MSDLPESWTAASVDDVVLERRSGYWGDSEANGKRRNLVHVVRNGDMKSGFLVGHAERFFGDAELERARVRSGDVLFTGSGDIGKVVLANGLDDRLCASNFVRILRPHRSLIDPRYLYFALQSADARAAIDDHSGGSTMKNLRASYFAEPLIPVPPLPEQRRIVAAIEEHFSRLDAAEASLSTARRRAEQLVGAVVNGAMLEWPLVEIGDIAEVLVGSTPSRADPSLWNGPVNWVSSGEVAFNRISSTRETISIDAVRPSRIHPPGTVLVAMIGEGKTRGQVAVLDVPAANNQNSAALRPNHSVVETDWLYEALASQYEASRRLGSGNNQPALNKSRVQQMRIPLPPIADQSLMTEQIRTLRQTTIDASKPVHDALRRCDAVRRSILAAAFSGQLVPQDLSDEAASVLLERIAAERAAAKPTRKKKAAP